MGNEFGGESGNNGCSDGQLTGSSSSSSGQSRIPLQTLSLGMHEPSSHVNSFSVHSKFYLGRDERRTEVDGKWVDEKCAVHSIK